MNSTTVPCTLQMDKNLCHVKLFTFRKNSTLLCGGFECARGSTGCSKIISSVYYIEMQSENTVTIEKEIKTIQIGNINRILVMSYVLCGLVALVLVSNLARFYKQIWPKFPTNSSASYIQNVGQNIQYSDVIITERPLLQNTNVYSDTLQEILDNTSTKSLP